MSKKATFTDTTPFDEHKDQSIEELSESIGGDHAKVYPRDTFWAIKRLIDLYGGIANAANALSITANSRSQDTQNRLKDQLNESSTDNEAIDARRPDAGILYKTLNERLNADFLATSINIKNFGAVGDGTTDDTAAFEAAMQYAADKSIDRVYIPDGKFLVHSTNLLVKNLTIAGKSRWSSVLVSDQTDAIFDLKTGATIENLGFEDTTNQSAKMIKVSNSDDIASYWSIRLLKLHIYGQEVIDGTTGIWALDAIYFDLDAKGLWDVTVDDVIVEWVHNGLTIDTQNKGWLTGSYFNNITVKGFSGAHTAIISTNNTARQISHSVFSNFTAEILYQTAVDAIGFIISGVGNEYDNLRLFADGAYSGHAIQLRYYGDAYHDAQNPSFAYGSSANNSFIGGTIEGDIDDPDGIRSLQHFDHLKLQIKDDKGALQQVFVEDEPMPNLLGRETLSRMLDYRNQQVLVTKSSTVASGADQYGKYIEITTAADPAYWSYLLTEPDGTAGALVGHDFSVGVRFRAMTDGSEITSGAIRLNEQTYNGKLLYTYRNPSSSEELKDYVWIYSSRDSYFGLGQSSRFDCVAFYVPANMSVRIYDAFLVSGRVTSFERVEQRDNFNNPKNLGYRNLVEVSRSMLASDTAVTNAATQTKVYQVDRDALSWLIGETVAVSVSANIHDYVNTNVSGRLAAYAELQLTFEDGSTFFASAGVPNFSATLIRGRYSCYYRIPNKIITKATCSVITPSGFTASYFQIGRPMVESGTVAHDFVPYIADA